MPYRRWRKALRGPRAGGVLKPPQCHAGQEPGWEATAVNGPPPADQVSDEKTNMCEPLLTRRNVKMTSELGLPGCPERKAHPWGAPSARELPACGPGGVRRIGGVSSAQALVGNRRTCRLDTPWSAERGADSTPLIARGRTASEEHRKRQSTDARHRGGPSRSSDEGLVMRLERRGRTGQVIQWSTPRGRN